MNVELGGYHVGDIEIAAAFDVHAGKVGRDVARGDLSRRRTTPSASPSPGRRACGSQRGPTLDGIGKYLAGEIEESEARPVDVAETLRAAGTDVLVSYLPVGSQQATEFYAEQALEAGCAFVNCIPVFIASDPTGRGASRSAACRSSATTSRARSAPPSCTACWPTSSASAGVRLDRTYQLNFGGNTDFKNMLERERLDLEEDLQDPGA